uniref:Uncharacterized protein n=1 Tax=Arion vulgaris TaxID=1028688 RepID=A0A0B6ZPV5_9EUPU
MSRLGQAVILYLKEGHNRLLSHMYTKFDIDNSAHMCTVPTKTAASTYFKTVLEYNILRDKVSDLGIQYIIKYNR